VKSERKEKGPAVIMQWECAQDMLGIVGEVRMRLYSNEIKIKVSYPVLGLGSDVLTPVLS